MAEEKKYPLFKTIGGVALTLIPKMPYFNKELGDSPFLKEAGRPEGLKIDFGTTGIYDVSKDARVPEDEKQSVVDVLLAHRLYGINFKTYYPGDDPVVAKQSDIDELNRLRAKEAARQAEEQTKEASKSGPDKVSDAAWQAARSASGGKGKEAQ
jgi:hypothetical protein